MVAGKPQGVGDGVARRLGRPSPGRDERSDARPIGHCSVTTRKVIIMINLADFPTYDPAVHDAPSAAIVAVGDRVYTYSGYGVVSAIRSDAFWGAPPRCQGVAVSGAWDGLAYAVTLDDGSTDTFDRSRLRRA